MEISETRGRPKKDMSYKAVTQRAEARKRFREYFQALGITQEKLAEICGIEVRHVQRLLAETNDPAISKKVAQALENHSGIIMEYWTGETSLTDRVDYMEQILSDTSDREILSATKARIQERFRDRLRQYECLFNLSGFRYECLADPTSVYDAVIVLNDDPDRTFSGEVYHRLTSYKDTSVQYYIKQGRLNEIVQRIQDTISFECFRKNDNDSYDGFDGRLLAKIGNIDLSNPTLKKGKWEL